MDGLPSVSASKEEREEMERIQKIKKERHERNRLEQEANKQAAARGGPGRSG